MIIANVVAAAAVAIVAKCIFCRANRKMNYRFVVLPQTLWTLDYVIYRMYIFQFSKWAKSISKANCKLRATFSYSIYLFSLLSSEFISLLLFVLIVYALRPGESCLHLPTWFFFGSVTVAGIHSLWTWKNTLWIIIFKFKFNVLKSGVNHLIAANNVFPHIPMGMRDAVKAALTNRLSNLSNLPYCALLVVIANEVIKLWWWR